jgi:uncharacterized protein (DUF3820 family)
VAKELSKCVDQSFISQASDTLRNNPSWQGWVAELDFLQRVRSCSKSIDSMWEVRKGFGMRDIGWRLRITQLIDYNDASADLPPHRPTYDSVMNAPEEVLFFFRANGTIGDLMQLWSTLRLRREGLQALIITRFLRALKSFNVQLPIIIRNYFSMLLLSWKYCFLCIKLGIIGLTNLLPSLFGHQLLSTLFSLGKENLLRIASIKVLSRV